MTDLSAKEYKICQERGHESNGAITGWENYAEYTCKWCGVRYYFKPQELVEIDPPKKRTTL